MVVVEAVAGLLVVILAVGTAFAGFVGLLGMIGALRLVRCERCRHLVIGRPSGTPSCAYCRHVRVLHPVHGGALPAAHGGRPRRLRRQSS